MSKLSTEVNVQENPFSPLPEIFKVENYANASRLKILGIDLSKGVKRIDYKGRKALAKHNKTRVVIEIEIGELLNTLANITDEQVKEARDILEPYLKCRRNKHHLESSD